MCKVNNVLMTLPGEEVFGIRKRNTSLTANLIHVGLKIGPYRAQALFDSGASASLISLEAVRRLGLIHLVNKSESYSLAGAFNGPAQTSYGELTATFYIKRKLYQHTFIVARLSRGTQIILGQDFWRGHNSMYLNIDGQARLYLNGDLVYSTPTPGRLPMGGSSGGGPPPGRGGGPPANRPPGEGMTDQAAAIFKTHVIPSRGERACNQALAA